MSAKVYRELASGALLILSENRAVFSISDENARECYKILWNKSGTIALETDGIQLVIGKNEVAFFTPTQDLHKLSTSDESCLLLFNREFYCILEHDHEVSCIGSLFYGSIGPVIIALGEGDILQFQQLHESFTAEFETSDNVQGEMLRILLKRMIILGTRIAKGRANIPATAGENFEIIRKFIMLVELNFRTKKTVTEYAEMLHKSPKTLAHLFALAGRNPPLHEINDRIVLEAKRLILYSDKSVKEIAANLGYADQSNFIRVFKRHTGTTPQALRSMHETN